MPAPSTFDYAVVRVVPRVEREEFVNAGVILLCLTRRYLDARIVLDRTRLAAIDGTVDPEEAERHLSVIPLVCSGDPRAGAIGRLPLAGRFHWLVSPRSTMIQMSPVHSGLCDDPAETLERLMRKMVSSPQEDGR